MPFELTNDHVHDYYALGYTVFRQVIPAALLTDLRREAEKGREITLRTIGPDAQRLQPLSAVKELNQQVFADYANLAHLLKAVREVTSPDAWVGGPERMGILFSPTQRPWATAWHRDFGPFQKRVDMTVFRIMRSHPDYFHQVNCALYDDDATWYVPASHLRDDFEIEAEIGQNSPWQVGTDQEGLSTEELEYFCLNYVKRMPRAIPLRLSAGDFALYRSHGWHLGCYVPSKKRATLHDSVWTPKWKASFARWSEGGWMEPTTDEQLAALAAKQAESNPAQVSDS